MKEINKFNDDLYDQEEDTHANQSRYRIKKRNRVKRALFSFVILVIAVGIGIVGTSFLDNDDQVQDQDQVVEEPEVQIGNSDIENPLSEDEESVDEETVEDSTTSQELVPPENSDLDKLDTPIEQNDVINTEEKEIKHKVVSGDSLYKLSLKYYNSTQYQKFLAWHNDIENSDALQVDQIIKIPYPPPSEWHIEDEEIIVEDSGQVQIHEVVAGDTLYKISIQYYNSAAYQDSIAEQNGLIDPQALKVGDKLEIPPIQ